MNLKDFASPLAAGNSFVKVSFGGFAGAGKSRTGAEFIAGAYKHLDCKKPVLFIDNEKGSRFLVPFFQDRGIKVFVKETIYLADVLEAFKLLEAGEISFLFIDSLTKVWYNYIDQYRNKANKVFMTLQDWGKILPAWQKDFSDVFVAVSGNVVFTGRGGYTYDMTENEETKKKEFVKSGVKMKMAGETPFEPDLNIWMDIAQKLGKDGKPLIWREALVLKDRSGIIDGKMFKNPSYGDFEPVVEYLIKVPKGEIAGATDTSNMAPKENPTYYEKKEQYDIEEERIKGAWEVTGLGTGASDKKVKVQIAQGVFGTSSLTEILKQDLHGLREKRLALEAELFDYSTAEDKNAWLVGFLDRMANAENSTLFDQKMDGKEKPEAEPKPKEKASKKDIAPGGDPTSASKQPDIAE